MVKLGRRIAVVYALISCIAAIAHAEIIGELDARDNDHLSKKFESLYLEALYKGQVPVKKVKVEKGDTVENILRRTLSFAGSYFPASLDAVTCDLNPTVCQRVLRPTKNVDVMKIVSPLQLEFTPGDWTKLQVGDIVTVPSFETSSFISPAKVNKRPGVSIREFAVSQSACQTQGIEECIGVISYLNTDSRVLTDEYGGQILVPTIDYTIDTE